MMKIIIKTEIQVDILIVVSISLLLVDLISHFSPSKSFKPKHSHLIVSFNPPP